MDALPDVVKKSWALSTTEKKLAFLVHMRSYFATDAETIEHFKKLRRVELRKKGTPTSLILHEEAAVRLEAVRDELPAGAMPSTDIGWPRGAPSLHGRAGIWNLHDIGFAVDFNATETPNLTDVRQKDLIKIVTGGQAWQAGGWTEGDYADTIKHTEQRAPMADPAATSDLGKKLAKVETEAQAASDRSEAFRSSVDSKALLDLRTKRRKDKAAGGAADDAALAKVIQPWTKAVDDELAANAKTLEKAGFVVASLKHGKALDEEKAAVSAAATAAARLRKGIKSDTLTDAQRKSADAIIAKLAGLVGRATAASAPPATDPERIKAIDGLAAAATTRLGGYGAVGWGERAENVSSSLDDAGWVLGERTGTPKAGAGRPRWWIPRRLSSPTSGSSPSATTRTAGPAARHKPGPSTSRSSRRWSSTASTSWPTPRRPSTRCTSSCAGAARRSARSRARTVPRETASNPP